MSKSNLSFLYKFFSFFSLFWEVCYNNTEQESGEKEC